MSNDEYVKVSTEEVGNESGDRTISYSQLYRFADKWDCCMLSVSYLLAFLSGGGFPIQSLVLGRLFNAASNPGNFDNAVNECAFYLMLTGIGQFVSLFVASAFAVWSAERQVRRIREEYFKAVLRQDMAYNDKCKPGEAASRLAEDTVTIQAGMGEKQVMLLNGISQFFGGFILAFTVCPQSYRLALVLLGFIPAIVIVFALLFSLLKDLEGGTDDAYASAGDVANEALSLFRTVVAYSGEHAELSKYDKYLEIAETAGFTKGIIAGCTGNYKKIHVFRGTIVYFSCC